MCYKIDIYLSASFIPIRIIFDVNTRLRIIFSNSFIICSSLEISDCFTSHCIYTVYYFENQDILSETMYCLLKLNI